MFAPRLFMALMDRRNGVALGTTSTKNQIRWRPWIKGICKCLKLYSTGLLPKRKTGIAVLFTDHLSDASRQFSQDCGHMITSSHATAGSGVYDRHASGCHSFGGHLGCVAFCNFTDAGNNRLLGQCQRPGRIMGHHCGVGLDLVRRLLGFIPLPGHPH